MSAKINLLESHQAPEETPARRVKKSVAQMLVRKALAEWVSEVAIRMRPEYQPEEAKSAGVVHIQREFYFDYDYPENEFPKRTFWRESLLLTYPVRDLCSFSRS